MERSCACGCGGIPSRATSLFLPGHHSRVTPRDAGGHPLPIERPLCACGCGKQLRLLSSTYAIGHYPRTPEQLAEASARRSTKVQRSCLRCRRQYRVKLSEADTRKFCSRWCISAERREFSAWNPLQQRCFTYLANTGSTFADLARLVGTSRSTLGHWFRQKGSVTRKKVLARLAEILEISYDIALREAGGTTTEDIKAQQARQMQTRLTPDQRRANSQRPRLNQRGKTQTPEHIAKRQAARKASGGYDRTIRAMVEAAKSPRGRMLASLFSRLRDMPAPSRDQIRQWEQDASQKLRRPVADVRKAWRPVLHARKLLHPGGRPPIEVRRQLITDLRSTWPRTQSGRMAAGFWYAAVLRVAEVEGTYLDEKALKRWWLSQPEGEKTRFLQAG